MVSLSESLFISHAANLKQALCQLDQGGYQILFIVDESQKLLGTLTDGDIRRALLKDLHFETEVSKCMHRDFQWLHEFEKNKAQSLLLKYFIPAIPILNTQKEVVDIIFLKDVQVNGNLPKKYRRKEDTFVFILAGGRGTRMKPVTDILPKALIPIKETPVIELIMEHFYSYGFQKFFLSLNYRAQMIKSYFQEIDKGFEINYLQEEKYCGTAGSLALLQDISDKTILVSNCDTLIELDIDAFYSYHKKSKNDVTILGVMKHLKVPYGVLIAKDGIFTDIKEKPEYDFLINAGIYIFEGAVLGNINKGTYIDMPDLLLHLQSTGVKLGIYPCSVNMLDIGHWEEYGEATKKTLKLK